METRVALIGIIVEQESSAAALNAAQGAGDAASALIMAAEQTRQRPETRRAEAEKAWKERHLFIKTPEPVPIGGSEPAA